MLCTGCAKNEGGKQSRSGSDRSSSYPHTPSSVDSIDPSHQKVVFWYQHTRSREEKLRELVATFNADNPHGINVTGEYAGTYQDIYRKMMASIQSGDLPNLVVAYQNQSSAYDRAGVIVDLHPFVHSQRWGFTEEELEDFFPQFLQQDMVDGRFIGFPPNRSMEVLYYNADWLQELGFEKPPSDWKQFREICCMAPVHPFSRAANPKRCIGYELDINASCLASMVFSRGGDLMRDNYTRYTLNTPVMKQTLGFLRDLIHDDCATLLVERHGDQADFAAGNLLFAISSTSGLPFFEESVEAGMKFEWSIAPLPHSTPEPVQNIYGASISVLKSTPEKETAAWIFLKWFTEPEQQVQWAKASNYFPVRKSVASLLEDYFTSNPNYRKGFQLLGCGRSEPTAPGYELVRERIEKTMVEILKGAEVGSSLERLEMEAQKSLATKYR
jgi:multiple sugar transport system substrate-binding protein/sn-glycerol 3-phosphate transport system substrate-binding protein